MLYSNKSKKTVLVTGGAGFLGSHICARVVLQGDECICLDNGVTGQKQNIKQFLNLPNFEFVRADVTSPYNAHIDWIFNFACIASPPRYQHDPVQTTKTNVLGALSMLELARASEARILQASTSEVYGDAQVHPQNESYWGNVNPIGVRSCYDEGKRCAETLFFDYKRMYKADIKVVRIFNTYGPNMHPEDGRVVSNFIMRALRGEPLEVYGDGKQTRSFCYVDDLIDAIMLMMNSRAGFCGPVNIGNPAEFTMLELAEKVLSLVSCAAPPGAHGAHSASKIKFLPLPADDPKQRKPDITLAKKELNWQPKVCLEDGLKETIAYFKKIYF